jgi:IS1 family transposase
MNRLDPKRQAQVIAALVEGNSIRSTVRMTGVAKNTVVKLLIEIGAACSNYQDKAFHNLKCRRVQCDEIWSFVGCKQKNATAEKAERDGYCGDVWTWTAIDADTKLVPCWMVGGRDALTAKHFVDDLASRLSSRIQLTTDGHKLYLNAVEHAFEGFIDYAMLIKLFGDAPEGEKRYSPAQCTGIEKKTISGTPDPKHVSTSYVERQNLTMRMSMRRFTRLTNAFSKKVENHVAAIALHFMYYNFCRIHQTLRVTPAMAAGVTGKLWEIRDIVALLG